MQAAGELPEKLDFSAITAEPPRDPAHGDIATNAAMVLAKAAGKKPRDIAEPLLAPPQGQSRRGRRRRRRPGLHQPQDRRRLLARAAARLPEGGHRLRRFADGRRARRSMSNTSRPTRPARCTWRTPAARWWAMRSPTCWPRRATPSPRNTTSTMPARRSTSSASRPTCATGGAGRCTSSEIPEGLYPGEYLKEVGAAIAKRDGARWIDKPEADWLPEMRAFAIAALMAEIKADLETLGVHIDVYSSERALVDSGAVDRAFQELQPPGPDLPGPARAAQGQEAGRLGGSRADAVPRHQVRRRGGPAAEEVRRQLDLLRQRHRLSPRQVPPRLCRHDRRLGRRPWRLRQAHEGGGERHHRGQGRTRRQALPDRARAEERRAGAHVQARRHASSPCATCSTRSAPMSCASPC